MGNKQQAKRVDIVSTYMVKERSILYKLRYIKSPLDVVGLVNEHLKLDRMDRECFVVITLDAKCQPTCIDIASKGSLTGALVHPREVYKAAILASSHSIIVCHNHPSGQPNPSKEDIQITERLKKAGEILGISLVDHIIIGECNDFKSLKEEGYL